MTIYDEISLVVGTALAGGSTSSLLSELLSIQTKSDLYPLRQFATNAVLSGQTDNLSAQHEVATYKALLESYSA